MHNIYIYKNRNNNSIYRTQNGDKLKENISHSNKSRSVAVSDRKSPMDFCDFYFIRTQMASHLITAGWCSRA